MFDTFGWLKTFFLREHHKIGIKIEKPETDFKWNLFFGLHTRIPDIILFSPTPQKFFG